MAQKIVSEDLRIDVSSPLHIEDSLEMAMTITLDPSFEGPRTVAFAYPGGGYGRRYYMLEHSDLPGPNQAAYHADRGWIFISCDPIGVGDSSQPDPALLTLEATAAFNHAGVLAVAERLKNGSLLPGLGEVEVNSVIGVGQSLGAMELIAQQGLKGTFDAAVMLAFSAIHTTIPSKEGVISTDPVDLDTTDKSLDEVWAGELIDNPFAWRYAFHWDDIPESIVNVDLGAGYPIRTAKALPPWASRGWPGFSATSQSPGVVASEAAEIKCPVLIVAGERDVIPDLRAEPHAYPNSPDITLFEISACAHMHNFSPQRFVLWERIHDWATGIGLTGKESLS